ncbi:acyl-CoA synthetase [Corynebacterium crudilactis]|uniref:Acyl-CoA synthetase n=1 Tax=Corynebacterium crudilactis TaxID=1652495 RepID=A0A172QVX8_9CORY|nr:acyl-CoA synthetase [Corynebacterium crudilactis]ANE04862.1 acyl-CoA synthetase [Corynebacterium crudilactis]
MDSVEHVLNLIRRGAETTVSMHFQATQTQNFAQHSGGLKPATSMMTFINPNGLHIQRSQNGFHIQRDGVDVLRGADTTRWKFGEKDRPYVVDSLDLRILGGTNLLINPNDAIAEMSLWDLDPSLITAGKIAECDTWVIPTAAHLFKDDEEHPQQIEIDVQTGVILAIKSHRQNIQAISVEFPSHLDNPAWAGPTMPIPEYAKSTLPATIPHQITQLPPQSENPRNLRILVTMDAVEGVIPRYRIGQTILIPLVFEREVQPLPGLKTTRRAWVRHRADKTIDQVWPIVITGDGWAASSFSDSPLGYEAELQGWFCYSTWGSEQLWNDLKIERIYAGVGSLGQSGHGQRWQELTDTTDAYVQDEIYLLEVILDVTLDGAVSPPLQPLQFHRESTHIENNHLWVLGEQVPVLRCWDLESGKYLGQTFVPIPSAHSPQLQFSPGIIHDFKHSWPLVPGMRVLSDVQNWDAFQEESAIKPTVPAPWKIVESYPDGLYALAASTETGERIALGRRTSTGQFDICPIRNDGYKIFHAARIKDQYLVQFWDMTVMLDSNFHILSSEELHLWSESESWFTTKGIAVKFTKDTKIIFLNQDSGIEITSWNTPEDHSTTVEVYSPTHFAVLVTPPSTDELLRPIPSFISVFQHGRWTDKKFEQAPLEI